MQDTAGEARTNSSVMYFYGPPHMAKQKQDNQPEHTYSSYVRIRDVALKTCQKRWMIGRSGERGSGISVLAARHDVDDTEQIMAHKFLHEESDDLQNPVCLTISYFIPIASVGENRYIHAFPKNIGTKGNKNNLIQYWHWR